MSAARPAKGTANVATTRLPRRRRLSLSVCRFLLPSRPPASRPVPPPLRPLIPWTPTLPKNGRPPGRNAWRANCATVRATRKWARRSAGWSARSPAAITGASAPRADAVWIDRLIDWSDAVIKRGGERARRLSRLAQARRHEHRFVRQGPGHRQYPRRGDVPPADGAAMRRHARRQGRPAQAKYGEKPRLHGTFGAGVREVGSRGAWRTAKQGGVWVVPPFGIDRATGKWSDGYGGGRSTDSPCRITSRTSWPCGCWPCTTPPARRSIATGRRRGFR